MVAFARDRPFILAAAMRILLVNQPWPAFGGSETYLLTIAGILQRFGHDVELHTPANGKPAEIARERGLPVVSHASEVADAPQVVVTQHVESAYEMAERFPDAIRVYVAHSNRYQPQRPPQLPNTCHAVVTMNDFTKRQCESLGHAAEVVRLRQPIDIGRFTDRGEAGQTARRVLLLGNHWVGPSNRNYRVVAEACERLGLELDHVGAGGRVSSTPEADIAGADVVIGLGRCAIEAMAAARAVYVFGDRGGDGWVTAETYESHEAWGFNGRGSASVIDADRLRADLERYDPDMGPINRQLAVAHHDAIRHTEDLVQLFQRLEPAPVPERAPLALLAHLARVQWETENRAHVAEVDSLRLRRELESLRAHLDAVTSGRRFRLAQLLGAPVDRLRALRQRRAQRRTGG